MILCDRPCSNKSEYGYCNTTYCINPVIINTVVGTFPPPQTRKTNADRIRSMTDEELSSWINDHADCNRRCEAWKDGCMDSDSTCMAAWLEWLKDGEA